MLYILNNLKSVKKGLHVSSIALADAEVLFNVVKKAPVYKTLDWHQHPFQWTTLHLKLQ